MPFADLHLHTFFSDGAIGPDHLMEKIYNLSELQYFALTDHDTLSGIEPTFRLKKRYEAEESRPEKRFIPGIELTLKEDHTGLSVHLLGMFPHISQENHAEELRRLDSVLGDFCRYRCLHRAIPDMDARIRHAFTINLDNIGEIYESAEEVISILRERAKEKNDTLFRAAGKENDVIQYPIPVTYQVIIDHWEDLVPSSSTEKITLYILRPDFQKAKKLAQIYVSEGMGESEALDSAKEDQGVLGRFERPPIKELGILEGLDLLQQARAITILAHPAVEHFRIDYDDFDRYILYPMIEGGLDGIEVVYPYDMQYRKEATLHYGRIAWENDLLISGGTDFHGDNRVELGDIRLDPENAERIIRYMPTA